MYSLSTSRATFRHLLRALYWRLQSRGWMVYFLLAIATTHRKRKLYIYLSPIVGGPTPIYIPLSEAQGRWPFHMVERRTLQATVLVMALDTTKTTRRGN